MKILVAYATKHGSTRSVAERLARDLGAELLDLGTPEGAVKSLSGFDAVVLGAPSYMGMWNKAAVRWAKAREAELSGKRLALFETGTAKGELSSRAALPSLAGHASPVAKLGGAISWKGLSGFERLIVKMVAKKEGDMSTMDEAAIAGFVAAIRKEFGI